MIERVEATEAKRRLGGLLDRVARGERFLIERRGHPVAALVPPPKIRRPGPSPAGILSLVGLFADWEQEDAENMVRDLARERQSAKDRPAPDLG